MASSRIDPVNHHSSFGFSDTMEEMLPSGCGIELDHARNEELFEIEQYYGGWPNAAQDASRGWLITTSKLRNGDREPATRAIQGPCCTTNFSFGTSRAR
jgi:hypothetical protein